MVKKKKAAIFIIQSTQGQWLLNRNMFPHRQFECFLGSGDLHFILSSGSMETLCEALVQKGDISYSTVHD